SDYVVCHVARSPRGNYGIARSAVRGPPFRPRINARNHGHRRTEHLSVRVAIDIGLRRARRHLFVEFRVAESDTLQSMACADPDADRGAGNSSVSGASSLST